MCCILSGRHTNTGCAAADAWVTCVHVQRTLPLLLCADSTASVQVGVPTYMPTTAHRGQPGCLCGHRVVMMMLLPPLRACMCSLSTCCLCCGGIWCVTCVCCSVVRYMFWFRCVCLMVGLSVHLHTHFGSIHTCKRGAPAPTCVCLYVSVPVVATRMHATHALLAHHSITRGARGAWPCRSAARRNACPVCGLWPLFATCRQRGGVGGGVVGACGEGAVAVRV